MIESKAKRRDIKAGPAGFVRGNDDCRADEFFERVLKAFGIAEPISNVAFVTVNHVVPTLPYYLTALGKVGRIAAVIPKGSAPDPAIHKHCVDQGIPIHLDINKDTLRDFAAALKFLKTKIRNDEKSVIIDIGGYFASILPELSADAWVQAHIVGIVEDTENGHQKYQEIIEKSATPLLPVMSVARSELKETEDYNVGKSIARAADRLLRTGGHTLTERFPVVGVIGFGKIGRSIVDHLKKMGVKRVICCESNPRLAMRASSLGVEVVDLDTLLSCADMVFSATGSQALGEAEFAKVKDNVFIASVTSRDDEFDCRCLTEPLETMAAENIVSYRVADKTLNFLHDGDAVNFLDGAVNGPFIYSVQAELLVSSLLLLRQQDKFSAGSLHELSVADMNRIAEHWMMVFDGVEIKRHDETEEGCQPYKPPVSVETDMRCLKAAVTQLFNLPEVSGYFVGRDTMLVKLGKALAIADIRQPIRPMIVSGMGGMGKTELLLKYGWQSREHFPGGCIYIPAESAESIDKSFRAIARQLDFTEDHLQSIDRTPVLAQQIYAALKKRGRTLLIFDDLPNQTELNQYLPGSRSDFSTSDFVVAVSSRNQVGWKDDVLLMDPQSDDIKQDSVLYLCEHLQCSEVDAKALAKELHYLPLALSQALCFMKMQGISVVDYLKLLKQKRERLGLLSHPSQETHAAEIKTTVLCTWSISIEVVLEKHPQAAEMLARAAWLHPDDIALDLFRLWDSSHVDRLNWRQQLRQYSLVYTASDSSFRVHRLLQEVLREQQAKSDKEARIKGCIKLLDDTYTYLRENLASIEEAHLHYLALREYCGDLNIDINARAGTEAHASMLYNFGLYFKDHKYEHVKAVDYFEHALALIEHVTDTDLIFRIKQRLASVYAVIGRHENAKQLVDELEAAPNLSTEQKTGLSLDRLWVQVRETRGVHAAAAGDQLKQIINQLEALLGKIADTAPALRARVHHYLGHCYANLARMCHGLIEAIARRKDDLKHWQTMLRATKDSEIAEKQTQLNEYTNLAVTHFRKALALKTDDNDSVEIIRTALVLAKLANSRLHVKDVEAIVNEFWCVCESVLSTLPRDHYQDMYYQVTVQLIILSKEQRPLFDKLKYTEAVQVFIRQERAAIKLHYGQHSEQYKEVERLSKKSVQRGLGGFFQSKPQKKGADVTAAGARSGTAGSDKAGEAAKRAKH